MPSQQAKQLHGGSSAGDCSGRGKKGQRKLRTTIKKRKRVLFQALSYRHLKAGGLFQTFEAWRGGRHLLAFLSIPPHKELLEEAFLKYLCCLVPPCHTSNLNPPPPLPTTTAQAVTLEFLWGPEKYHPDREKSKEMREG